ncbi:MAG: SDR family NAD(P)-dependent oxidoreductase [Candidimonas sp.]|nr:MAG: SDR family NAD(P)-dependent oxidoreductase [Candidimonas sp.]TAM19954.1 MAG: SDR family NAD(P)-dependent oxidoreductase [Candidimonas sp.]TAM76432.1 MAG: SDR family NAD(P)-dependent oxidoreductase [Candidimonas sp.]
MFLTPLNPRWPDWHGKRVWLIGASSGIGAAVARDLLQRGARVALSARREDALVAVAANSALARILPMDVTDPAAWKSAHKHLIREWGGLDLTVFCAAQYEQLRSWELQSDSVRGTIEVNLASVYYGLEVILPDLIAQGNGSIALVASVAGYLGLPNATVYGPTKAALINLAELLYAELHPKGLGVYLVNPGFVKTKMTASNKFPMPAMISVDEASRDILRGMEKGVFEIHFPKRFTRLLKLMSLLPYRLRLAALAQMVGR